MGGCGADQVGPSAGFALDRCLRFGRASAGAFAFFLGVAGGSGC